MALIIELLFELVFTLPLLRMILLAVVPALLLLWYVRRKDALEPEPSQMIWKLVGWGAVSVLLAMLLESAGLFILTRFSGKQAMLFQILHWFVVVGLGEEISKYFILRRRTWNDPAFNCTFDGVVYAVAVSAGFALAENILYLFRYGSGVLFMRAIVSIPAHICFAVLMGTWYGGAKKFEIAGEHERLKWASVLSVLVPALAHGAFDFIATNTDKGGIVPVFVIYVIAMFVISWRLVRRLSENDAYMAQKAEGIDWNNNHQN
ncbi:MAG: PrsW family intramembrane metalloprotease [Clostridia bacterium]|nr:PrsW family intramembrane metalloprotease [Clostridia bacterium]